jgi:hypothetical protein
MLIRKLCKYLCAPANITEDTVAISQRFHVVKYENSHLGKFTERIIKMNNKVEVLRNQSFAKATREMK